MKYDFDLILEEENSLSKIIKQIKEESVVLEFGSATGRMTKYLKEKLNCKVYIVELDAESAMKASKFAEDAIIGDIETYEWLEKWENIQFDYIVFADVLEHLRNPEEVLSKTKMLLKDSGKTIFSIPNVGHNSIMLNLFNNIFNYTPVGLLDNTHIHLFAYNTLKVVCSNAGYVPVIEDAVYVDVGETEIGSSYEQVNDTVKKELKKRIYNNVYQFLFVLQKTAYVKRNNVEIVKKIIPYTNDYKFQVYFDLGNGWMEENSTSIAFHPDYKKNFKVTMIKPQQIKALRIDPIDCKKVVEVKEIILHKKSGTEKLDLSAFPLYSNAKYTKDNKYFFCTQDPNFYITALDCAEIEYLEMSLEYMEMEEEIEGVLDDYIAAKARENELVQEIHNLKEMQKAYEAERIEYQKAYAEQIECQKEKKTIFHKLAHKILDKFRLEY